MTLDLSQLSAITEKKFIPDVKDNVYGTNPAIARFNQKKQTYSGGLKIVAPLISSTTGSAGKYFSGFDTVDTSPTDNISASQYDHVQLQEPIKISRREELISMGDAAKIRLVAAKMKIAEKSFRDNMALGLFSDGTTSASTGVAGGAAPITGLRAVMSITSTYGGIATADLATWIAVIDGNSGTNRALSLNLVHNTIGNATYESDKPSVMFCRQNIQNVLWSLFQPAQRMISEEMSDLGFKNVLAIDGIPVVVDSHMKANAIDVVNEDSLQLWVHESEDMRYEKVAPIENQVASLGRLSWMGNLVCTGRRYQGEIQDLLTA